MHIATLSYQYNPKENLYSDSKTKFQHRHILTTIKNPQKKPKQRRSFLSDSSTNSKAPLPSIKTSNKRPNSIRIKGSGLTSSKLNETSASSFHPLSRSHSRQSNKSTTRSRSVTPSGTIRSKSKLVRLQFGYPVKMRSSDFYAPNLSQSELRLREESFVNDSIRSAHQTFRSSVIPHYEPLNDPNLKNYFQSPLVYDVVHKTLNIDLVERPSKINNRNEEYRRIVAKHSSGYSKLNGYDCIPSYAPARHRHSITYNRHQSSANSSLTSFPTNSSAQFRPEKKFRQNHKPKQLAPIATSSPLSHPTGASSDGVTASSVSQD